jgi:hypothetical protein
LFSLLLPLTSWKATPQIIKIIICNSEKKVIKIGKDISCQEQKAGAIMSEAWLSKLSVSRSSAPRSRKTDAFETKR